ncbi:hypothetical protein, partial [Brevibacillus massiliensis]|uniref:hypothetical protein n=1 Tax=Brevibacillus massiliensis TaxID=1118054 RepID=UPI000365AE8C
HNSAGGVYGKVKITGEGYVEGDLDCLELGCTGVADIKGNFRAADVSVRGVMTVAGNTQANKAVINGQADFDGEADVKEMRCNGVANFKKNLAGEEVRIWGSVSVQGNCEAERFLVKGSFATRGLLNAGNIDVQMYWPCQAAEIGGERITVKKSTSLKNMLKSIWGLFQSDPPQPKLTAEVVEGDEIYLEHTEAKIVRGNHITIGPGCEIELVEYKQSFQQAKGTQVHHSKEI